MIYSASNKVKNYIKSIFIHITINITFFYIFNNAISRFPMNITSLYLFFSNQASLPVHFHQVSTNQFSIILLYHSEPLGILLTETALVTDLDQLLRGHHAKRRKRPLRLLIITPSLLQGNQFLHPSIHPRHIIRIEIEKHFFLIAHNALAMQHLILPHEVRHKHSFQIRIAMKKVLRIPIRFTPPRTLQAARASKNAYRPKTLENRASDRLDTKSLLAY
jgi:hypothetical protein